MVKDIQDQNEQITPNSKQLTALKELFPACFKKDGSFDLERFKSEITDQTQVVQEGYELKFLGKSYAKLLASTDTTTVIQPNTVHNELPENKESQNIYISGDNLDGLKHLLKSYNGKIKCIYIDPPYNTGSDGFVYQDKFNYTSDSLQAKLSISEDEADRILDLTKRGSASHSAWLMFMYSRLVLARDLLTPDGVIFISIDDNEQANLKLLCDEVFGEENFIGQMIHNKLNSKNDSLNIQKNHEFISCYQKKICFNKANEIKASLEHKVIVKKRVFKEGSEFYILNDSITTRGDGGTLESRKNLGYTIYFNPVTKDFLPVQDYDLDLALTSNEEKEVYTDDDTLIRDGYIKIRPPRVRGKLGVWTWELDNFKLRKKEIVIRKKKDGYLVKKRTFIDPKNTYLDNEKFYVDVEMVKNSRSILEYSTNEGTKEFSRIIGSKGVFSNPKNLNLLKYLISLIPENDFKILDFFSGSASSAHAVMQLNSDDDGTRRFIAVQLQEELSKKNPSQKAAYEFLEKNNLTTTLDYVGYERIKRAAAKIKAEHPEKAIDLGFKHFILQEPNSNTLDKLEKFDPNALIADKSILDDFGKPTILTTWMNADGYGLSAKPVIIDLAGYQAYYYQKHLYLIEGDFTLKSMEALLGYYDAQADFNPENMVLFGYSFPDWSINEMIEKNLKILNDGEKNLKINYSVRY